MKRILLILTATALMVAMSVVMAVPAFAQATPPPESPFFFPYVCSLEQSPVVVGQTPVALREPNNYGCDEPFHPEPNP